METRPSETIAESTRLRRKLEFGRLELAGVTQKVLAHPRISEIYPEYLFSCYGVTRASVPLMQMTRERALGMNGDPTSAMLEEYLEGHIAEETGHDQWFLDDLEAVGWDRPTILTRPQSLSVAIMMGTQYYWILQYHPVALVGFLIALECHPPSTGLINELISKTGYSQGAFRGLLAHAEVDPHHGAELYRLLDHLPLTAEQSAVVALNALHSLHMAALSLDEIVDGLDDPPTRSAGSSSGGESGLK